MTKKITDLKVGDLVKVNYVGDHMAPDFTTYRWSGVCTWTDGYKYTFLIGGEFDTWNKDDLEAVGAKVISEGR